MNLSNSLFRRRLTLLSSGILGFESLRRGVALEGFQAAAPFGIAASAALLIPTLIRNCPWFGPVICRFPTVEREVWLTIDDGPDPGDSPEILEVLGRFEAVATFFAIGNRVLRNPDLAQAIVRSGHSLQTHTLSHPKFSFWAAGPRRVRREIEEGMLAVESVTGARPTQFRAPVGLSNPFVHSAVFTLGLQMIGWSVAGFDGVAHVPERVVERVLAGVGPGAILLLHEGAVRGMKPGTRAITLEKILTGLRAKGFRTVIPSLSPDGLEILNRRIA